MFIKSTLPNGLRVVTSSMPHTRSVSLGVYVGAGSRYETPEQAGISHFVEHMLFKGTAKRPRPEDVTGAIENVGGMQNASTDREARTMSRAAASFAAKETFQLRVTMGSEPEGGTPPALIMRMRPGASESTSTDGALPSSADTVLWRSTLLGTAGQAAASQWRVLFTSCAGIASSPMPVTSAKPVRRW